jgi:hypothetical protein
MSDMVYPAAVKQALEVIETCDHRYFAHLHEAAEKRMARDIDARIDAECEVMRRFVTRALRDTRWSKCELSALSIHAHGMAFTASNGVSYSFRYNGVSLLVYSSNEMWKPINFHLNYVYTDKDKGGPLPLIFEAIQSNLVLDPGNPVHVLNISQITDAYDLATTLIRKGILHLIHAPGDQSRETTIIALPPPVPMTY